MNDYSRAMAIKAINQIDASSSKQSWVWTPDGRQVELLKALIQGQLVPDEFGDDDWDSVISAFWHFGAQPPSRRIAECCRELPLRLPNF